MRLIIPGICCAILLASYLHAQKPADEFESIRQLVCDGHYQQAIPRLEAYTGQHDSRAGLFLGKAHLGVGDFVNARRTFQMTTEKYPQTLEAHKCRYKLAMLSYLEGDAASAKAQFQRLGDHPDGPLAAEAAAFAKFIP